MSIDSREKASTNAEKLAKTLATRGYKSVWDFDIRAYRQAMETERLINGKSCTESLHGFCKEIAKLIDKPKMIPWSSSDIRAMGSDNYRRTAEDRINPQYWASPEKRDGYAAKMEELDGNYASAADMSRYTGTRKLESLGTGEMLRKDQNGKYYTTAGCKAGEWRKVNISQLRYAFTHEKKDVQFEKIYLNETMRTAADPLRKEFGSVWNWTYTVVTDTWAKHQRPRIIPIIDEKAYNACIRQQEIFRENMQIAKKMELAYSKYHSVIHPDYKMSSGYRHFGDLLDRAGFERSEDESSLHADRTEFNSRMKELVDEEGNSVFSKLERSRYLGHNREQSADSYGG